MKSINQITKEYCDEYEEFCEKAKALHYSNLDYGPPSPNELLQARRNSKK